MKKPVPLPVIIGVCALVIVGVIFGIMKISGGPAEFPKPATSKVVPQYVWDAMNPTVRSKMAAEGYTPGDVKPNAGQPQTAPPRG